MNRAEYSWMSVSLFQLFLIAINFVIIVNVSNERNKAQEDLKSTEQQLSYCQQDMNNKMMEVEFTWFMPDECEWALLIEECLCDGN